MPGNPLTDPNWANEVTDQITTLVGTIRDKTTNNAIVVVRAVVFGLLAAILGLVLVVLLLVLLTRLIQAILSNWIDWDTAVYVSYFIIGGLLTLTGAFLMTKRHS
jgi:hypothetical protein